MDKPKLMTMPPLTYYSGKNVVVNEEKYDQLHDRIRELEKAMSKCLLNDPPGDCYAAEVVDLRAENKRLREALLSIALRCEEGDKRSDWIPTILSIARKALEGE